MHLAAPHPQTLQHTFAKLPKNRAFRKIWGAISQPGRYNTLVSAGSRYRFSRVSPEHTPILPKTSIFWHFHDVVLQRFPEGRSDKRLPSRHCPVARQSRCVSRILGDSDRQGGHHEEHAHVPARSRLRGDGARALRLRLRARTRARAHDHRRGNAGALLL